MTVWPAKKCLPTNRRWSSRPSAAVTRIGKPPQFDKPCGLGSDTDSSSCAERAPRLRSPRVAWSGQNAPVRTGRSFPSSEVQWVAHNVQPNCLEYARKHARHPWHGSRRSAYAPSSPSKTRAGPGRGEPRPKAGEFDPRPYTPRAVSGKVRTTVGRFRKSGHPL
jgi:hypothetical protein